MTNTDAVKAPAPARPNLDAVIGANVHRLMWMAQDSQTKMAPIWGMTQTALSLKLRGRRPWFASEIDAAARHYGVSRDALFSNSLLPEMDSNHQPAGNGPAVAYDIASDAPFTDASFIDLAEKQMLEHRASKERAHRSVAHSHEGHAPN